MAQEFSGVQPTNKAGTGAGILARKNGASIAYHHSVGGNPGVVFIHGFHSDMQGGKALALESWCQSKGISFLRLDLYGHGQSSGDIADGTISLWKEDAVAAIDELTSGPQILVGSSLGGWISLLTALERPKRIAGIVGIAAAPDFTEDLMASDFTPEQQQQLIEQGFVELPNCIDPENPWIIKRSLIEDGRNNLLLRDPININCPVRLIQGQQDADVPWKTALKIANNLQSDDVVVHLVKDGDHRLNRDQDLARMIRVVESLVQQLG